MKNFIVLGFILAMSVNFSHSQISNSDQKKLLKITGKHFVREEAKSSYPFGLQSEIIRVDTSTTILGDTTGLIFNNEYVLFRDFIHFKKENELFSLIKPTVVTIGEYQEFKNHVRDSIARVKLIMGFDEDDEATKFLKLSKEDRSSDDVRDAFYRDDRTLLPFKYQLDWKVKLPFDYSWHVPILADMYLSKEERFRKKRTFDERKFGYKYVEFLPTMKNRSDFATDRDYYLGALHVKAVVTFDLSVLNDNGTWAESANHNFDESSVLSQIYDEINEGNPIVGLLGTQAKAFCHWKQIELQKSINKRELPFTVVVTLADMSDLGMVNSPKTLDIQSFDHTENWRISQQEYTEFIDFVMDSITREALYVELLRDDQALKFLNYQSRYFDENYFEYVDLDEATRGINRELFSLNYKTKIRQKDPEVNEILKAVTRKSRSSIEYSYTYLRCSEMSSKYDYPYKLDDGTDLFGTPKVLRFDAHSGKIRYFSKHAVNTDKKNELGYGSGIRFFTDLGQFIDTNKVSVYPEISIKLDKKSEKLIPSLSYDQALAFYNWKYRIDKFNSKKEDWQQFIFPSEEQFQKIQNGESIIIPQHEVQFPTPLFRYVVHVYPKSH